VPRLGLAAVLVPILFHFDVLEYFYTVPLRLFCDFSAHLFP
jgi:hypothetical protein